MKHTVSRPVPAQDREVGIQQFTYAFNAMTTFDEGWEHAEVAFKRAAVKLRDTGVFDGSFVVIGQVVPFDELPEDCLAAARRLMVRTAAHAEGPKECTVTIRVDNALPAEETGLAGWESTLQVSREDADFFHYFLSEQAAK